MCSTSADPVPVWVTGPDGIVSRSELRIARKARNRKLSRQRRQERQRQHRQLQQEQEQQPQRAPLPPIKEELPLTNRVVVPPQSEAQNLMTIAAVVPTVEDGCEHEAVAAADDSVVAEVEEPAVDKGHLDVSGASPETPPAGCDQVLGMEASAVREEHMVEDRKYGDGDRPADSTCAEPVDRDGRQIFSETSEEEDERTRVEMAAFARRMEATLKVGSRGPSYFESQTALPRTPLPPSPPPPPPLHLHPATEAAFEGVPLLQRVAQFALACGLGAVVAPQLLQIMIRTVYGEAYARSVTAMSADVVENMLAVFWRHEIAPFSVQEVFSRLAFAFHGNGGIGQDLNFIYFSPSTHLAALQPGWPHLPCYQSGGWDAGFGGMCQPYVQSGVPATSNPAYSGSPWGAYY